MIRVRKVGSADKLPLYGKSVLILTSHYPYPPGESFLETEIPIWVRYFGDRVTVMPRKMEGQPRDLPTGVVLSSALSDAYKSPVDRARALLSSVIQPAFWREIKCLRQRGKLSPKTFLGTIKAATHISLVKMTLKRERKQRCSADIIYTYWLTYGTYAAVSLKDQEIIVSRAHRGDLYEYCSPNQYLYFRRQFLNRIDQIYSISEDGINYLKNVFCAVRNVKISRLGVKIPELFSIPTPDGHVSILSVSFCVPVKNVDKIVDALHILAQRRPEWKITWSHIGDGPLRPELEARAKALFKSTAVDWRFLGQLDNADVLRYIESHSIDFILNASSSEGIPVSLMEAMARGVPAVAPDVGGISELVSNENGVLLPADATSDDIASTIIDRIHHLKSPAVRCEARKMVEQNFDCEANYRAFVEDVAALAASRSAVGPR